MKLPNGDRAEVSSKVEDYVLNPNHRTGQHKARVFASILGIDLTNADVLKQALLRAAQNPMPLKRVGTMATELNTRYNSPWPPASEQPRS